MSYDWKQNAAKDWLDRYPSGIEGWYEWTQQTRLDPTTREIFGWGATPPPLPRPCVFISHRQADEALARRYVSLASSAGFDFWLDVLDPVLAQLQSFSGPQPTSEELAVATARTIEMALYHSSHVLAIITANSAGSAWIPYEYGRVARSRPEPAAARVDPSINLAEYYALGVVAQQDVEVSAWLQREYAAWSAYPP